MKGQRYRARIKPHYIGYNQLSDISCGSSDFKFNMSHIFIDFETENDFNKKMNPFMVSITAVFIIQKKFKDMDEDGDEIDEDVFCYYNYKQNKFCRMPITIEELLDNNLLDETV